MKEHIVKTWKRIKEEIRSQIVWDNAVAWAQMMHPSWVQLATQKKRPEIRETYRKKILDEYRKEYWSLK